MEDTFAALKELLQTKKVKHIGVSNFTPQLLKKAVKIYPSIICNQVEYHPFFDQSSLLRTLKKQKMFLTAYCPLARGGVLKNTTLKSIGKKHKKNAAQIALRWLLDQENVIAIPKAKTLSHITSNFNIFDFQLDAEDKHRIKKLTKRNKRLVCPPWAPF